MSNPFVHIELNTDDLARAKKFYKNVFDWKLSDAKAMPYTLIDVGGTGTGGGMQKSPMTGAPSSWLPYVQVADVRKTIAKASKSGARILEPYIPIGEMGACGIFVDPTGATIGVWEAAKAAPKRAAAKTAGAKKTTAKKGGAKKSTKRRAKKN